jgi:hypothetical protein
MAQATSNPNTKPLHSLSAASRSTVPSSNETDYPVEIFGHLPAGFELRNQSVHLLAHWHGKTLKAISEFAGSEDDLNQNELNNFRRIARDIFEAIMATETPRASEVAKQLTVAVEMAKADETNMIEDILDVDDLRRLATNLTKATAPLHPTKRVGALQRGRKLTRAGLLHRYHAFLVQELETIGVNLYGDRDYPIHNRPFDDAVNVRCKGGRYGLFDESKLPARARAVLKSLKIDTERNDDAAQRKAVQR